MPEGREQPTEPDLSDIPDPPVDPTGPYGDMQPVNLEQEMRRSYLDYAMSVIVVARACRMPATG